MSKEVISTFYDAFNELNAEAMVACYHDEIEFEDPAFGKLKGEQAKNMWRMLCKSQTGKTFKVVHSNITYSGDRGTVKWEAHYHFSQTNRPVHNIIQASFVFKDGKIITHHDHFDLRKWSKQALGFKGFLLGGTRFFKNKLQGQTKNLLAKFEAKQSKG